MGKKDWTPEERALYEAQLAKAADAPLRLAKWLDEMETRMREDRERAERRRQLLRRLLPFRRAA